MAEILPYAPQQNKFLDVLRQIGVVAGAGLSADPRARPLGQMLQAGSLLLAEGQDRRRQGALQSVFSRMSLGEMELPQARQALAQQGLLTPKTDEMLQTQHMGRQNESINSLLMKAITNTRTEGGPERGEVQAGTGDVSFLEPPTPQLTPERFAQNMTRMYEQGPGGAGLIALGFSPQVASAMQQQIAGKQAEQQLMQRQREFLQQQMEFAQKTAEERRKQQEAIAQNNAAANLYKASLSRDPQQLAQARANFLALSDKDREWATKLGDPSSDININTRTYLMAAGVDPEFARPEQIASAIDAYEYDQTARIVAQKKALLEATMEANWRAPMGHAAAGAMVDPQTLAHPPAHMSMAEAKQSGMVTMDPAGLKTLRGIRELEPLVERLKTLSLGGKVDKELAQRYNIPEGETLPTLFWGQPVDQETSFLKRLYDRVGGTVAARFNTLVQNKDGVRTNAYERIKEAALGNIASLISKEGGKLTEGDVNRARELLAAVLPRSGTGLADSAAQAELQFAEFQDMVKGWHRRALGYNPHKALDGGVAPNMYTPQFSPVHVVTPDQLGEQQGAAPPSTGMQQSIQSKQAEWGITPGVPTAPPAPPMPAQPAAPAAPVAPPPPAPGAGLQESIRNKQAEWGVK